METMLDLALEVVKNRDNEPYNFDTIFDSVETNLKSAWFESLITNNYTYEELRVKKIGELYRLLTVDGRFERNPDGLWTLSKYYVPN